MEEELKLQICSSYITKRRDNHTLQEVYVNNITKKAYHLYWRRSDGTYYADWLEKKEFDKTYEVFEHLREHSDVPSLNDNDYKIEINNPEYLKALTAPCPVCNGTGRVPDDSSTAGDKACPKCFGTGFIYAVQ